MQIFVVYYTNKELNRLFSIFKIPSSYVTYQREYEKMVELKGAKRMEKIEIVYDPAKIIYFKAFVDVDETLSEKFKNNFNNLLEITKYFKVQQGCP